MKSTRRGLFSFLGKSVVAGAAAAVASQLPALPIKSETGHTASHSACSYHFQFSADRGDWGMDHCWMTEHPREQTQVLCQGWIDHAWTKNGSIEDTVPSVMVNGSWHPTPVMVLPGDMVSMS